MKLLIFSIYDSKAESWSRPHFAEKVGGALRQFIDLANDKEHPIGQHPEDYAFYQLGEWNDDEGTITMLKQCKSLGIAIDFKKKTPSGIELVGNQNDRNEKNE